MEMENIYFNENNLHNIIVQIFTCRKMTFTPNNAIVSLNKKYLFSCCNLLAY